MRESKHLASLINVPPKTIYDIFKSSTDWEFILKIDALLEAAARKVVKVALSANDKMNPDDMEAFVDTLPMRGRTSLLSQIIDPHSVSTLRISALSSARLIWIGGSCVAGCLETLTTVTGPSPATGDLSGAKVIKKFGDVPDDLSAL